MKMKNEDDAAEPKLLLIGKAGSGKSATANTVLNDPGLFESKISPSPVTRVSQSETGSVNNRRVTLTDTPGISADSRPELKRALQLCAAGAHVILFVLSLSTFTEQEMKIVSLFEEIFGAEALRFTLVLFTHADRINNSQLRALIRRNPRLSDFINRCRGGFCGINNKDPTNRQQVTELMEKVERLVSMNRNSCYTLEMMEEEEKRRKEEEKRREEEEKRREEEKKREEEEKIERVRRETEIRVRRECEDERARILEEEENHWKRRKQLILSPKCIVCVMLFVLVGLGLVLVILKFLKIL